MGNISSKEHKKDKSLEKVTQFYNQITKENVIAQKQKITSGGKKSCCRKYTNY